MNQTDRKVLILTFDKMKYKNAKQRLEIHGYNNFIPLMPFGINRNNAIYEADVMYIPKGSISENPDMVQYKLMDIMQYACRFNIPILCRKTYLAKHINRHKKLYIK